MRQPKSTFERMVGLTPGPEGGLIMGLAVIGPDVAVQMDWTVHALPSPFAPGEAAAAMRLVSLSVHRPAQDGEPCAFLGRPCRVQQLSVELASGAWEALLRGQVEAAFEELEEIAGALEEVEL